MNQIILDSIHYAMCDKHINDHYSKHFLYNDSSFILFQCDFVLWLTLWHYVIFGFWWRHNKHWLYIGVSAGSVKTFQYISFGMSLNICIKYWIDVIYAFITWIANIYVELTLYKPKYISETLVIPLKFKIILKMFHFFFIHMIVYCMVY